MTTDEAIITAAAEGWAVRNLMNQALTPESTNWFCTLDGGAYNTVEGYHRRLIKSGIGHTPAEAILAALFTEARTDEVPSWKTTGPEPKINLFSLGLMSSATPIKRRF